MSPEMIAVIVASSILCLLVVLLVIRRVPKPLNNKVYVQKWRVIQSHCKDKNKWRDAIIAADKLLDGALKRRKFKGKTPGERLVSAQRSFTNNDGVWFAHNLFKKLMTHEDMQPKEADTKKALSNFRQALRDIKALPQEPKS